MAGQLSFWGVQPPCRPPASEILSVAPLPSSKFYICLYVARPYLVQCATVKDIFSRPSESLVCIQYTNVHKNYIAKCNGGCDVDVLANQYFTAS